MTFQLIKANSYKITNGSIWDIVKCKNDHETYYLTLDNNNNKIIQIIKNFAHTINKNGKLCTYTGIIPFVGPVEKIEHVGESIGAFVKLYEDPNLYWKCQKEFDCIKSLRNLPNFISIDNFPKPRILNSQLMLLPLIFNKSELIKFCKYKTLFYKKLFDFTLDLSHITTTYSPQKENFNTKLCKVYDTFLLTIYLWRKANNKGFYHADMEEPDNMRYEDLCSVVHRHTGKWPRYNNKIKLKFQEFQYTNSFLPVIIDYDYVYFTKKRYPGEDYFDYLTGQRHILSVYNENDLLKYYERVLYESKDLIEQAAMMKVLKTTRNYYLRKYMFCKNFYTGKFHKRCSCRLKNKRCLTLYELQNLESKNTKLKYVLKRVNSKIVEMINLFNEVIKLKRNFQIDNCFYLSKSFRKYLDQWGNKNERYTSISL